MRIRSTRSVSSTPPACTHAPQPAQRRQHPFPKFICLARPRSPPQSVRRPPNQFTPHHATNILGGIRRLAQLDTVPIHADRPTAAYACHDMPHAPVPSTHSAIDVLNVSNMSNASASAPRRHRLWTTISHLSPVPCPPHNVGHRHSTYRLHPNLTAVTPSTLHVCVTVSERARCACKSADSLPRRLTMPPKSTVGPCADNGAANDRPIDPRRRVQRAALRFHPAPRNALLSAEAHHRPHHLHPRVISFVHVLLDFARVVRRVQTLVRCGDTGGVLLRHRPDDSRVGPAFSAYAVSMSHDVDRVPHAFTGRVHAVGVGCCITQPRLPTVVYESTSCSLVIPTHIAPPSARRRVRT
ncbi:hypothetical protein A0H81_06444 [Grifola frondosa]|uniref:Uncharacterized protein n=1 Tax=Grifola frondosa TaxID=5627 RepID=A0A1C7MAK2_GRIFR|nr:hypothetical protein A0H81_06444 [Grifola frondosa]